MPETNFYIVTGIYRQEIHANIDALSEEEAAIKAMELFEKWLETMPDSIPEISFGPEPAFLDEDVLIRSAQDPSPSDPFYWSNIKELIVCRDKEG